MIPVALALLLLPAAGAQEPIERVDAELTRSYPAGEPGAAVVITRAGQTLLAKGYGLANLEHRVPVAPTTVFRLASVTKVLVAAAALRLVERGKLDLGRQVGDYLRDQPAPGRAITMAQLLSHTGGLGDYLDRPDSMRWVRGEFAVAELVDACRQRELLFAPGTQCRYSNSGYVLLGAILEQVAGRPLGEVLRQEVFEPAGMTRSAYDAELEVVTGRAASYEPLRRGDAEPDWTQFRNARYYSLTALYASGGCVGSAEDLARFLDAWFDGKLVGEPLLARSLQPAVLAGDEPCGTSQAGWQLDRVAGRRALMKGGALPGVCTWVLRLPEERLSIVLLSNRSPGVPRAGKLVLDLAALLLAAR